MRIDPEDGVQCEACHGPASGWRGEHTQAGWTHEQSFARGMIDLHSVPVRAKSCDAGPKPVNLERRRLKQDLTTWKADP